MNNKDLERIRRLRLMDDDFMTVFFKERTAETQLVLRIIMQKPDLTVIRVALPD